MIKVENIEIWGFEHAIRGMRNPLNSWDKSDSDWGCLIDEHDNIANREHYPIGTVTKCNECGWCEPLCDSGHDSRCRYIVGTNDLDLMRRLYKAGTEHRKYARQIFVSMDITAPDYWFKEFSTYKVGTVENSTSTMHKIQSKEFTLDDFSVEHLAEGEYGNLEMMKCVITCLNVARDWYNKTKDKDFWWQMIQMLPMSYNYRRTVTMNYENVFSMIHQRENHKLDEWRDFVEILKTLPYIEEITNG